MPTIGVQQLRANTAQVLREVHERHAEYVVTRKGLPVARLLPAEELATPAEESGGSRGWAAEEMTEWNELASDLRSKAKERGLTTEKAVLAHLERLRERRRDTADCS
jgi:prevent-host-death family protein